MEVMTTKKITTFSKCCWISGNSATKKCPAEIIIGTQNKHPKTFQNIKVGNGNLIIPDKMGTKVRTMGKNRPIIKAIPPYLVWYSLAISMYSLRYSQVSGCLCNHVPKNLPLKYPKMLPVVAATKTAANKLG